MDKYLPTIPKRKQILLTQIDECQTLIYRNELENLTFKQKKDADKQTEVKTNNGILTRKLDLLYEEWEKLNAQDPTTTGSSPAEPGPAVQPDAG